MQMRTKLKRISRNLLRPCGGFEEMKDKEKALQDLERVEVKCPHCGAKWETSMLVEWCNCLQCEQKLIPKLHIVVNSENGVIVMDEEKITAWITWHPRQGMDVYTLRVERLEAEATLLEQDIETGWCVRKVQLMILEPPPIEKEE